MMRRSCTSGVSCPRCSGAGLVRADAAEIGPGQRVLDVGCGTGVVAREAARRVGPEAWSGSTNPRMLAVARRVAPEIEWRQRRR